jgi:hypothetical protein
MTNSGFIPPRCDAQNKTTMDIFLEGGLDQKWNEVVEFGALILKWPDVTQYANASFCLSLLFAENNIRLCHI